MRFTMVGLGKLGAPIAAAIASRGHKVCGVDKNQEVVDKVNKGVAPVQEFQLQETMDKVGENIRATTSLMAGLRDADIVGILVPTPSMKNGLFSPQHVWDVCYDIGWHLRKRSGHLVVSVMSTLIPGTMEKEIKETIEKRSGRPCGDGWSLTYNPELVAIGSVIKDYLNPDLVIIGQSDTQAGTRLANFWLTASNVAPHQLHFMSLTNAEIVKMSINMFVSTKIAFANLLGDLCESFPSGDIDLVSKAVRADSRIGHKYFRAGMPYGGTCFPRDVHAFEELCEDNKVMGEIAWAVRRSNKFRARRIMNHVRSWANPDSTIAILGLSYKPGTTCTIGSPSLIVAEQLRDKGYTVVGYNPFIDITDYPDGVEFWSLTDCLTHADVIMIATQEPVFRAISQKDFKHRKKLGTIIDCWRILRGKIKDSKKIRIRYVGVGGTK